MEEPGSDGPGSRPWFREAALWLRERERTVMPSEIQKACRLRGRAGSTHELADVPSLPFRETATEPPVEIERIDEFAARCAHVEELLKKLEL